MTKTIDYAEALHTLRQLKRYFPWLGTDNEASGADTVDTLNLMYTKLRKAQKEADINFAFEGIISELTTWFTTGTPAQQELLITSLRQCADAINEEMPTIEE